MKNWIDEETQSALEIIHDYCIEHEWRIATAESVSAGLVQFMLASVTGAACFFCGGITAYNCFEKARHFAVPIGECKATQGVSRAIAAQMAHYACREFNCELGLSLTGFAAPIPEQDLCDPYAFGCLAVNGEIIFTEKINCTKSSFIEAQQEYASLLLKHCAAYLVK